MTTNGSSQKNPAADAPPAVDGAPAPRQIGSVELVAGLGTNIGDLVVGASDEIYALETVTGQIVKWTSAGLVNFATGANLITIDGEGNLYAQTHVPDPNPKVPPPPTAHLYEIKKFDPAGNIDPTVYAVPSTSVTCVVDALAVGDGKVYAVLRAASGFDIVDITNRASPTTVANFAALNVSDVVLSGDYFYVAGTFEDDTAVARVAKSAPYAQATFVSATELNAVANTTYAFAPSITVDGDDLFVATRTGVVRKALSGATAVQPYCMMSNKNTGGAVQLGACGSVTIDLAGVLHVRAGANHILYLADNFNVMKILPVTR